MPKHHEAMPSYQSGLATSVFVSLERDGPHRQSKRERRNDIAQVEVRYEGGFQQYVAQQDAAAQRQEQRLRRRFELASPDIKGRKTKKSSQKSVVFAGYGNSTIAVRASGLRRVTVMTETVVTETWTAGRPSSSRRYW